MQIDVYLHKLCNIVSRKFRIWMMKFSPTLCRCPWCSACCWTCASPSCQSSSCGPPPDAWPININVFIQTNWSLNFFRGTLTSGETHIKWQHKQTWTANCLSWKHKLCSINGPQLQLYCQSIDPSGQYLFSANFSGSPAPEKWVYLQSFNILIPMCSLGLASLWDYDLKSLKILS